MNVEQHKIVLIRHGQSIWNREERFTGWTDVRLTDQGIAEAKTAAQLLQAGAPAIDVVHTSLLSRAIETADDVLRHLGRLWVPVHKNWRLNERHYGALQGQSKPETIAAKGEEQVHRWRRSFQVRPPALDDDDPRHPRFDPRYARLAPELLPCTESLEDVLQRVLPYWYDAVVPDILAGTGVMIAAHGNTLRALMMHLARISAEDIAEFEIPVASPILCSLDENLRAADYTFLGAS